MATTYYAITTENRDMLGWTILAEATTRRAAAARGNEQIRGMDIHADTRRTNLRVVSRARAIRIYELEDKTMKERIRTTAVSTPPEEPRAATSDTTFAFASADCGCTARLILPAPLPEDTALSWHYCPLHAAAQAMRELLESLPDAQRSSRDLARWHERHGALLATLDAGNTGGVRVG